MENILNLTIKKEVFNDLIDRKENKIYIDFSKWWKKRLMDVDTGRFKDFNIARVCCGDSDKVDFLISNMEFKNTVFIITVKPIEEQIKQVVDTDVDKNDIEETPTDCVEPEVKVVDVEESQELEESTTIDNAVVEDIEEDVVEEDIQTQELETCEIDENIVSGVIRLLNNLCESKDVFVVNMPNVTIRTSGQIIGCKKRLITDCDCDVRFNFEVEEFTQYQEISNEQFLTSLDNLFKRLVKNNYLFINRNKCGFRTNLNNELVVKLVYVPKRKYLFGKR